MEAIFSIFGSRLPPINTNAGPSEVAKWKRKSEVKDCFEGMFKKMNPKDKNSSIVLASVIDREKINNQTAIKYSDFEDNNYEEEEGENETEDDEEDDV
ncbi:hypothetical protein GLOIN_2v1880889 [Rhizophagus irregularis DAOM 181602=DAOM 197198]|nr:hypothetical protein GLOIN_2v1880889 [Rhizophagus irregularis DAOM 181602=DAOM 197198]